MDKKQVRLFSLLVEVDAGVAAGIAILDRAISYWGLMALRAVVYMVSGKK